METGIDELQKQTKQVRKLIEKFKSQSEQIQEYQNSLESSKTSLDNMLIWANGIGQTIEKMAGDWSSSMEIITYFLKEEKLEELIQNIRILANTVKEGQKLVSVVTELTDSLNSTFLDRFDSIENELLEIKKSQETNDTMVLTKIDYLIKSLESSGQNTPEDCTDDTSNTSKISEESQ